MTSNNKKTPEFKDMSTEKPAINRLLDIMARLRDPENGCPWDLAQSFDSIAPYTIEESYEVDQAIRDGNRDHLKSELGDLLFQSVFHAQLAKEEGSFDFSDVVEGICCKMIDRHPHVFGDSRVENAEAQTHAWEARKEQERREKAKKENRIPSVLDDVGIALPALMRAQKLQKRAARIGFDWPDIHPVLDKIKEEANELVEALEHKDPSAIEEEYGDLLFTLVNLGRHLKLDAEETLRKANEKFIKRFKKVEQLSVSKNCIGHLDEMENLWQYVKKQEKTEDL